MDTTTTSSNSNTQWIATLSFVVGLIGLAIYYFLDIKIQRKNSQKEKLKLPPDAQPDKSVIQCDETDCSKTNPSMKCGQCKMVYYCGSACQRQHWKYHKADCKVATEKIYSQLDLQKDDIELKEKAPADATCAICLTDQPEMKNPIVLKACQHVFCYKCLEQYENYHQTMPKKEEKGTTPCPCCRTKMEENAREAVVAKALLYAARAGRKANTPQEKREACQLALEEMKALGSPESDQDVLQANILCAQIALVKGDFKDALKIWEQNQRIWTKLVNRKKQVDALLQKGQTLGQQSNDGDNSDSDDDGEIDEETYQQMQQIQNEIMAIMAQGGLGQEADLINCRLECISVHLEMQDWDTAKQMYQDIMTEYPEQSMMSPPQQRKVFMGFARCLYEEGNYEGSIRLGEAAIEMNRHFPGIHQYVALAYKEQGDLQKAQDVMAQAVLYETPWDSDHREEVRELWVRLMEEG